MVPALFSPRLKILIVAEATPRNFGQHRVAAPHRSTPPTQACSVIGLLTARVLNVFLMKLQARQQPFPLAENRPALKRWERRSRLGTVMGYTDCKLISFLSGCPATTPAGRHPLTSGKPLHTTPLHHQQPRPVRGETDCDLIGFLMKGRGRSATAIRYAKCRVF